MSNFVSKVFIFIFSFFIVLPIGIEIANPYEDSTKTMSMFILLAVATLFMFFIFLCEREQHTEGSSIINVVTAIVFGCIILVCMIPFKSNLGNFVTAVNYHDIGLTLDQAESLKDTEHYKEAKLATEKKDPEYLRKYFKEKLLSNFYPLNEKDTYELITYVKMANDPIVNQEFKKIYDDGVITQKEYDDFKKFTIENAKDIK